MKNKVDQQGKEIKYLKEQRLVEKKLHEEKVKKTKQETIIKTEESTMLRKKNCELWTGKSQIGSKMSGIRKKVRKMGHPIQPTIRFCTIACLIKAQVLLYIGFI